MKKYLSKFFESLYRIPKEKLLHFTVGLVMLFFNLVVLRKIILIEEHTAELLAFVLVFFVSILKEVLDKKVMEEEANLSDATITTLGGALGYLISIIL